MVGDGADLLVPLVFVIVSQRDKGITGRLREKESHPGENGK
jgi:hypothetical protein